MLSVICALRTSGTPPAAWGTVPVHTGVALHPKSLHLSLPGSLAWSVGEFQVLESWLIQDQLSGGKGQSP